MKRDDRRTTRLTYANVMSTAAALLAMVALATGKPFRRAVKRVRKRIRKRRAQSKT